MTEEIKTKLKTKIASMTELEMEEIDEQARLADLGIDSLQALELLVMLERTYQLEIPQEALKHFTSISNVADLIARRMQEVALA
jgi:acyl carrier protein